MQISKHAEAEYIFKSLYMCTGSLKRDRRLQDGDQHWCLFLEGAIEWSTLCGMYPIAWGLGQREHVPQKQGFKTRPFRPGTAVLTQKTTWANRKSPRNRCEHRFTPERTRRPWQNASRAIDSAYTPFKYSTTYKGQMLDMKDDFNFHIETTHHKTAKKTGYEEANKICEPSTMEEIRSGWAVGRIWWREGAASASWRKVGGLGGNWMVESEQTVLARRQAKEQEGRSHYCAGKGTRSQRGRLGSWLLSEEERVS